MPALSGGAQAGPGDAPPPSWRVAARALPLQAVERFNAFDQADAAAAREAALRGGPPHSFGCPESRRTASSPRVPRVALHPRWRYWRGTSHAAEPVKGAVLPCPRPRSSSGQGVEEAQHKVALRTRPRRAAPWSCRSAAAAPLGCTPGWACPVNDCKGCRAQHAQRCTTSSTPRAHQWLVLHLGRHRPVAVHGRPAHTSVVHYCVAADALRRHYATTCWWRWPSPTPALAAAVGGWSRRSWGRSAAAAAGVSRWRHLAESECCSDEDGAC